MRDPTTLQVTPVFDSPDKAQEAKSLPSLADGPPCRGSGASSASAEDSAMREEKENSVRFTQSSDEIAEIPPVPRRMDTTAHAAEHWDPFPHWESLPRVHRALVLFPCHIFTLLFLICAGALLAAAKTTRPAAW